MIPNWLHALKIKPSKSGIQQLGNGESTYHCHVYNYVLTLDDLSLITLYGHKLAVTSVDWTMNGSRSLLVSCSDDRV